jgi:hypothetical protein
LFLDLLDLESNDQMVWSMRMIAITLIALAGNMWQNSKLNNNAAGLRYVARLMIFSATSLGVLTLLIPAKITIFTGAYAAIGFLFAISYLINLTRK